MVDIKFVVNGKDISSDFVSYFTDLEIIDKDGNESDELNVTLTNAIKRPEYNDEIKIWINFIFYGTFLVQSTETNYLNELNIKATGTNFSDDLKVKKSKSYKDKTLKSVVEEIAGKNKLEVKADFGDITLTNLIQKDESDLHFLNSLAKKYDAIFSIKNKTLIFIERTAELPNFPLDLNRCESWSITHSNTQSYKSCTAKWRDTKRNKNKSVTVGDGEPILVFKGSFKTETEARKEANAKLKKTTRGTKEGSATKSGEYITAGGSILVINSKQDDGTYTVVSVTTTVSIDGYKVQINFSK